MRYRTSFLVVLLAVGVFAAAAAAQGQAASETFKATAEVKTAGGATATAPVSITVKHKMSDAEVGPLMSAFKTGGAEALRKALVGVAPTGSVQLGNGKATPTRITVERVTDKGRLLTIVTDRPLLFLGAGKPEAQAKAQYDFAVIDLLIAADGKGAGTLAPAARIKVNDQGAFTVEDYSEELIRLTLAAGKPGL